MSDPQRDERSREEGSRRERIELASERPVANALPTSSEVASERPVANALPTPSEGARESTGAAIGGQEQPTEEQLAERRRRVDRATRNGLAAVLCLEAFCVLLVPRAIAQTPTGLGGVKTGLLIGFAVILIAAAAVQRRRWGVGVGSLLQVPFVLVGVWVHAFFIVGVLFVGVWLYLLNVRHELAGTPGGARMLVS
jgi:Protein of unknown function (DUF4233)